jgi:hypothetical protein
VKDRGLLVNADDGRLTVRLMLEGKRQHVLHLRASRETELAEQYPIHVVCEWIGNSPKIAEAHYLQMREEYFQRAVAGGGATGGAMVVQKLVPSAKAPICTDSQESERPSGLATQTVAVPMVTCGYLVPPRGVEPLLPD